jgi:hypothetical protein
MRGLLRDAALIAITAIVVTAFHGHASQTAPMSYGDQFGLICLSGNINAVRITADGSLAKLSWRTDPQTYFTYIVTGKATFPLDGVADMKNCYATLEPPQSQP